MWFLILFLLLLIGGGVTFVAVQNFAQPAHLVFLWPVRRQAFLLINDNYFSPQFFRVLQCGQARSEALCCP